MSKIVLKCDNEDCGAGAHSGKVGDVCTSCFDGYLQRYSKDPDPAAGRRISQLQVVTQPHQKQFVTKSVWWCRWCGKEYTPKQENTTYTGRDGFCPGGKCKQAHHRAFKRYALLTLKKPAVIAKRSKKVGNAKKGKK